MADSLIIGFLKALHLVFKSLISGWLYYKKTVLELLLLVFLSWGAFIEADTMSEESWNKADFFAKRRYRIGELIVIATAIKGFFSTAVADAKKEQKKVEDDTAFLKRGQPPIV